MNQRFVGTWVARIDENFGFLTSKTITRAVKAVGFGGPLELAWLTLTNETFPKSSLRSNVSIDGR